MSVLIEADIEAGLAEICSPVNFAAAHYGELGVYIYNRLFLTITVIGIKAYQPGRYIGEGLYESLVVRENTSVRYNLNELSEHFNSDEWSPVAIELGSIEPIPNMPGQIYVSLKWRATDPLKVSTIIAASEIKPTTTEMTLLIDLNRLDNPGHIL